MDQQQAQRAISLIDLTDLSDDSTEVAVLALCERAARHATAAVCVWPDFVAAATEALADCPVRVATVVNFPTGDERPFAVGVLAERAIGDGADEIDVVLPHRDFAAGRMHRPAAVLEVVRAVTTGVAVMKVILETGELADDAAVDQAAQFAIDHGADFVKTSTGKTAVSATPEAAATMLRVIADTGRRVGLKPSGGIRTAEDAQRYLALADDIMGPEWVSPATFRFGASGLLDALLAASGRGPAAATTEASAY